MSPKAFAPHPTLSPQINANIAKSEIEGGAWLNKLAPGRGLRVTTKNTTYEIRRKDDTTLTIQAVKSEPDSYAQRHGLDLGPQPCTIAGSTWGGSMIKVNFVGRGMYMEFSHVPPGAKILRAITSPVQEVEEIE